MLSLRVLASSQKKVAAGGPISTFTWTGEGAVGNPGTQIADGIGGSGTGAKFNIIRTGVAGSALVTSVTINFSGSGYKVGDILIATEPAAPGETIFITVTAVV